jgi:uncharacterized protein
MDRITRLAVFVIGLTCPMVEIHGQASSVSSNIPAPEVRTTGTARRSVRPDLATVTFQFSADGKNPRAAGIRVADRADSLRRALAALGIPRDSLISASRWSWWRGRMEVLPQQMRSVPRTTVGPEGQIRDMVQDTLYRAHDAIQVRIRDLAKVGAVLDTAMAHGITDISGVQFSASDVTAAQEEALREATTRARHQAEAIATASGAQLGRILSLSTQADNSDRLSLSPYASVLDANAGAAATIVVQPSIPVSVTVFGRWELINRP